jgi:hypothetical protein
MTDLVFVQSNKLGKEYEGNLFVGEKSYSRFILRSKQRKGLCSQTGSSAFTYGDAVMFLDGNLNFSPDSMKDYIEKLRTYNLVIASKRHPKSSVTIPKSRAFLSRAFNLLVKMAIGIPQKDTQVGFKVGKGEI